MRRCSYSAATGSALTTFPRDARLLAGSGASPIDVRGSQRQASDLGALHRSRDCGQTWETLPLPLAPNGTIWNLATHAADPDFLLASSVNGEVFCSTDAGDSWSKFAREFGEVHALIWVPN
jgi:photosystem II stability/assembly factor-like uncharacterized protein